MAYLQPCESSHSSRVRNYIQYFNDRNIEGFVFSNGFNCNDDHKFEKLNNLYISIFELKFYQYKDKWKHDLILIEVNKNESDRVVDLLIYINHYALNEKLNVF